MELCSPSIASTTTRELKAILGAAAKTENGEDEPDWEDRLNQVMQSRGRQPNLSFFAFTATPKGKTLELFGRKGASGLPEAFHLYSRRQAIGNDELLVITAGFVIGVRQSATIDRTVRESIRVMVRRILKKYGYPSDP